MHTGQTKYALTHTVFRGATDDLARLDPDIEASKRRRVRQAWVESNDESSSSFAAMRAAMTRHWVIC